MRIVVTIFVWHRLYRG